MALFALFTKVRSCPRRGSHLLNVMHVEATFLCRCEFCSFMQSYLIPPWEFLDGPARAVNFFILEKLVGNISLLLILLSHRLPLFFSVSCSVFLSCCRCGLLGVARARGSFFSSLACALRFSKRRGGRTFSLFPPFPSNVIPLFPSHRRRQTPSSPPQTSGPLSSNILATFQTNIVPRVRVESIPSSCLRIRPLL